MANPSQRTLLVVHHTTSPALEEMLTAVLSGAHADGVVGVSVVSGALKHFFDQVYYPCLTSTTGSPYGLFVHGNLDVEGAQHSVAAIATGLGWERVCADVTVLGPPSREDLEACWELGAVVAATLAG